MTATILFRNGLAFLDCDLAYGNESRECCLHWSVIISGPPQLLVQRCVSGKIIFRYSSAFEYTMTAASLYHPHRSQSYKIESCTKSIEYWWNIVKNIQSDGRYSVVCVTLQLGDLLLRGDYSNKIKIPISSELGNILWAPSAPGPAFTPSPELPPCICNHSLCFNSQKDEMSTSMTSLKASHNSSILS